MRSNDEHDPARPSTRRVALFAGAAGYLAGALYLIAAIFRSPSSTAGIALLFVPFYAAIPGLLGLLLGGSGAVLWRGRRGPVRAGLVAAGIVFSLVVALVAGVLADRLPVVWTVEAVARMTAADELTDYFDHGRLKTDPFVLGAIALNPAADAELLDRIARLEAPALHARLQSMFPVLGENRRGYAVLRLVARHPNVEAHTLRRVAESPDEYVAGEVAGNSRTPVEVLRALHARGGYLIEWGLARNPATPGEVLVRLTESANEYTRAGVARNPAAPPEASRRLEQDAVWHVRQALTLNPSTTTAQLARLAGDSDERVRRAATSRVERATIGGPSARPESAR